MSGFEKLLDESLKDIIAIKITKEARNEIRHLVAKAIQLRSMYIWIQDNASNPSVDNVTIIEAQRITETLKSEIVSITLCLRKAVRGGAR